MLTYNLMRSNFLEHLWVVSSPLLIWKRIIKSCSTCQVFTLLLLVPLLTECLWFAFPSPEICLELCSIYFYEYFYVCLTKSILFCGNKFRLRLVRETRFWCTIEWTLNNNLNLKRYFKYSKQANVIFFPLKYRKQISSSCRFLILLWSSRNILSSGSCKKWYNLSYNLEVLFLVLYL